MKPIREFWEKCGFMVTENKSTDGHGGVTKYEDDYYYPNNRWGKQPKIDLNNLFKYAVPDEYQQIIFQHGYCAITVKDKLYEGSGDTAEDALFWAIWEVLK